MINGIINVYKEKDFTSHDVVAKLRGILKQKKIGHTGTLDPDATGVLPICLGNATKLCDLLTDKDKTYEAVLLLGKVTDTQDITGTVLEESEVNLKEDEIREAILSFIGGYDQLPPMYSAISVGGKRLYELAREGIEIERATRKVEIKNITIHEFSEDGKEVRFEVECSKGTYIRTLCHDIGRKLGCGGCMKSLERTKVAQFLKKDALTIEEVRAVFNDNQIEDRLTKVDDMFPKYDRIVVKKGFESFLFNGNALKVEQIENFSSPLTTSVLVYNSDNVFKAIYEYNAEDKIFKPIKMFL